MNIQFAYRSHLPALPAIDEHLNSLWQIATLLDAIGMPIKDWCAPGRTPEKARRNTAFDENGPSRAAIAIFEKEERADPVENYRTLGVWNGKEDKGGAVILNELSSGANPPNSSFTLQTKAVTVLEQKQNVIAVINGLLKIWDAPFIEVSPGPYPTRHKVFEDRPGVGWMLYLPQLLTSAHVPEAAELIRVLDVDGKPQGTIIVSIADEPFSVKNKTHIEAANAIEVRLADQDLLPRFSNL